ncbi:hypothetical protein LIER_18906 [Lithospermum erythrorhizon]|uniref:GAG-pre-integrase domain-containing protein n=1 Tax=Lithospermum erythrorhizon TaxID=34254 RepID=A0AAV3QHF1_LITER
MRGADSMTHVKRLLCMERGLFTIVACGAPYKALSNRKGEDVELWHKRLAHTNYRNIQQIISKEAVRGIPTLDVKDQACGDFQVGKQTKSCHRKLQ